MKVELNDNGIFINGQEVAFPTTADKLAKILGEPSRKYYERNDWRIMWDDLGVYASGIDIISLMFVIKPQEGFQFAPMTMFAGEVIVEGKRIEEYTDRRVKVKRYQLNQAKYMGEEENEVFAYSLGKNYDYKEDIDESKYEFKPITGEPIVFSDFDFKLAIIQELMYNQELLVPRFAIHEFIELYKERKIDYNKEGYAPIPEAVEYFRNLQIDSKLADKVTSIYQDGGNKIYMNIAPLWDGEDDTFTIRSYEDVALFPNLKKMTIFYDEAGDELLETLKAKGIEAEWL